MKKLLSILIYIFSFFLTAFSQDTTIVYFNINWEATSPDKAQYIQYVIQVSPDSFVISKMTTAGLPISIIEYKSLNPLVEQGTAKYFDFNGNLIVNGYYNDGFMDSIWHVLNNNTFDTLNYNGIKDIYLGNVTEYPFEEIFFIVEEMPIFGDSREEGIEPFRKYVATHLHYPIRALNNTIEGRIFIQFIVGPDGKTYNPKILKDIDKDLAFESIRVIRDSPLWIPGRQRLKETPVQIVIPIFFTLKN